MTSSVVSNEMYVILGASGNTGSIVANSLLSAGKKVRVVGRDPGRLPAPFNLLYQATPVMVAENRLLFRRSCSLNLLPAFPSSPVLQNQPAIGLLIHPNVQSIRFDHLSHGTDLNQGRPLDHLARLHVALSPYTSGR